MGNMPRNIAFRFEAPDMSVIPLLNWLIQSDDGIKIKGRSHVVGVVEVCDCGWPYINYGLNKCIWCAGEHKSIVNENSYIKKWLTKSKPIW